MRRSALIFFVRTLIILPKTATFFDDNFLDGPYHLAKTGIFFGQFWMLLIETPWPMWNGTITISTTILCYNSIVTRKGRRSNMSIWAIPFYSTITMGKIEMKSNLITGSSTTRCTIHLQQVCRRKIIRFFVHESSKRLCQPSKFSESYYEVLWSIL